MNYVSKIDLIIATFSCKKTLQINVGTLKKNIEPVAAWKLSSIKVIFSQKKMISFYFLVSIIFKDAAVNSVKLSYICNE